MGCISTSGHIDQREPISIADQIIPTLHKKNKLHHTDINVGSRKYAHHPAAQRFDKCLGNDMRQLEFDECHPEAL